MRIKGITDSEESIINSVIESFRNKYEFYCYGSRVKGDFCFLSDLDMMIKGIEPANYSDIECLKSLFDNSNLPYVVNISDYYNLDKDFYKIIEKDLIKV